ncbi:PaaI family thioesterase [Palleronia sp.]|uniref:PaaI family thioesterase n=1 Tax=Palleronia sp. TaxID=1940284 RepID=UPI0035C7B47B
MGGPVLKDETGTQRALGYVLDLGGETARATMTVDERHTNRTDRLHGGLVTLLLDSAMGGTASLAIDPDGMHPVVTLSLTTNYVASGALGDELVATARIQGGGRKVKYVDGTLKTADGRIIATATGVFKSVAGQ